MRKFKYACEAKDPIKIPNVSTVKAVETILAKRKVSWSNKLFDSINNSYDYSYHGRAVAIYYKSRDCNPGTDVFGDTLYIYFNKRLQ